MIEIIQKFIIIEMKFTICFKINFTIINGSKISSNSNENNSSENNIDIDIPILKRRKGF